MLSCHLITQAILRLQPGAAFAVAGDGLADIEWIDEVLTQPTDPAIEAEIAVIEAEIAANVTLGIRAKVYVDRGCTPEAMINALWKKEMEADSTDADALAVIRGQVEDEYPMVGE
jgi:hypothetical protein